MIISNSKYSLALVWLALATSSVVHIEPAATDVLSILALGLFLLFGMRIPPGFGAAGFLLGLYLTANIVASAMAPEPMESIRSLSVRIYMAASCLLFVCLYYENGERVQKVIWSAYIVAVIIAIGAGLVGYYGGPNEQLIENGRVRALFKDPNVYGPFAVPVAMYALAKLETANRQQFTGYATLLAFCTFGLLLGFSRGSWINFTVSLLLYYIIRIRTQKNPVYRRRVVLTALSLLIGGIIAVGGLASTEKIQSMLDKRMKVVQYYDTGEGGRLTRQAEILRAITVTPIGIGAGQSEIDYNFGKAPHQLYLHVLIEAGWIGGFSFFAFLLFTLWKGGRYIRKAVDVPGIDIAVYACIIGVMVQSLFIDSTHWRHFFLLFALIWGPILIWENRMKLIHGIAPTNPRRISNRAPTRTMG
jgi:O-antigen ligase